MSVERRFVLLLLVPLAGCDWFTDLKRQPKIDPWEAYSYDSVAKFRGQPSMSVPITGAMAPGYMVSYAPMPQTVDSMSSLANPTPMSDASVANGKKYYQINCTVCHGASGRGDGPATRYGFAGISIVMDMSKNRSDGYLFGMIRNGRGLMPSYNRIEEMDRWDLVNYIRALQGSGSAPPDTTSIGAPGETGDKLPGATRLGPNLPSRYRIEPPRATGDTTRRDSTAARDTTRRTSGGAQ
jgi:mono/diheme cytochrome c family protein